MRPLYKSTIVIWSPFDPSSSELEDLACEATSGEAYCSHMRSTIVIEYLDDTVDDDKGMELRSTLKDLFVRGEWETVLTRWTIYQNNLAWAPREGIEVSGYEVHGG